MHEASSEERSDTPASNWRRRHRRSMRTFLLSLVVLVVAGSTLWFLSHQLPPAPPRGQECGYATNPGDVSSALATAIVHNRHITKCFWIAYQQCRSVTMTITESDAADATQTSTYTIMFYQQHCDVYVVSEGTPRRLSFGSPVSTDLCTRVTRERGEFHVFDCTSNENEYFIVI